MDFLNEIKTNTLIIAPTLSHEKILLEIDKLGLFVPIKLMSIEEIKSALYGKYDENTIYELEKKLHVKRNIIEVYLKNIYFIDESTSFNMNFLRNLKQVLEEKKLWKKNPDILNQIKTYDSIYVFGYDVFTRFEEHILNVIEEVKPVKRVKLASYPIQYAYQAKTSEEEFSFVFEQIASLLKQHIPFSKIVLTNITEDDEPILKRIARKYHIPVSLDNHSFFATENYKKQKKLILEHRFEEITDELGITLLQKLNKIKSISEEDIPDLLDQIAKNIKITSSTIRIESLCNHYFSDDEYVFILSCNASILPRTHQDEDYLYDSIKPSILENTYELNELEEIKVKHALNRIKNKIITARKENNGLPLSISPVLEGVEIIPIHPNLSSYSDEFNKRKYTILLDQYRKYNVFSDTLSKLKGTYELDYQGFDHTYQKIEKEDLKKNVPSLLLSYSSLNHFYECKFKFYLEQILSLKEKKSTFQAYLGSLFHDALTHIDEELDFDLFFNTYLLTHPQELTPKEMHFLEKSKTSLNELFIFLKDYEKHTTFKKKELEKKFYLDLGDNVTFMGIIDKILYDENNAFIVDYKTGNTKVQLYDTYYGLSMQLPIYAYLLEKNSDVTITGFFLQHILEGNFKKIEHKTLEDQKKNALKLNGYTISDEEIIEKMDSTYKDSRFISGMKQSKNGFYAYTKLLSERQMTLLFNLVEEKIKAMKEDIMDAEFSINPKKLRGENISCTYCPYKSICFMTNKDIVELEEKRDLNFLGGETDEMDA